MNDIEGLLVDDEGHLTEIGRDTLREMRKECQHYVDRLGELLANLLQAAGYLDPSAPEVDSAQAILTAALTTQGNYLYVLGMLHVAGVEDEEIHEALKMPPPVQPHVANILDRVNRN